MRRFAETRAALGAAEQWLLPSFCLLCHEPAGRRGDPLVCPACRSRWRRLPEPCCARCGQPTFGVEECRICAEWPEGFGRVRSAVWLDEGARLAVHLFKYEGWQRLADPMADRLRPLLAGLEGDRLVPVPVAPGRRRRRGYNQAEVLAASLGRLSGRRVAPTALRRVRETPSQTALTPGAREANLAGAFAAGSGVRGAALVLVDDVFTTGATLVIAARALLRAGARAVEAVTFARAKPLGA
jgi:ComF family protein